MKLIDALDKLINHYASSQEIHVKNVDTEGDGTIYITDNLEDLLKFADENQDLHIDEYGQIGINEKFISIWCHWVESEPNKETKDEAPF